MKDLRSPLAKVKGLGSAGDASRHFWLQRITALALIPLIIWFCFSIALLPHASHPVLVSWLQSPFNTIMMLLVVILAFHHGLLGLQIIIQDYIATYSVRLAILITVNFLGYFLMLLGIYSILKITLNST